MAGAWEIGMLSFSGLSVWLVINGHNKHSSQMNYPKLDHCDIYSP